MHLQYNTTLNKKLVEAGVRVKMTPEKAKTYSLLGKLIEVIPEEEAWGRATVIEEKSLDKLPSAAEQAQDILASLGMMEEEDQGASASMASALVDASSSSTSSSASAEEGSGKGKKVDVDAIAVEEEKRKAELLEAERNLLNKFIDITAVLPPVPERGTFDVSQIKESKYFFS